MLLAQELFTKEFDRKLYLTSLSYPKTRQSFLLGRLVAIYALQIALLFLLSLTLLLCLKSISAGYEQATPVSLGKPYLITFSFIAIELFVIAAIASLLAIRASTPSFVLIGTVGFTLAARSFAPMIALLENNTSLMKNSSEYKSSIGILGYLLPDFNALDTRAIALYDSLTFLPHNWTLNIATNLLYGIGLITLSIWSLNRKKFI
ncbi:hypothetical protein GM173_13155 [Deefgea chitinilytica]|uniref:ABC transporter permease n=1 Tax=Deefgea chitinilytica TaxID=570276 RepID=A0ABS2CEE6_9NEIS|nr:hypothetical protein [Deefgea chitinilytica]MBM9889754.1 hypothetical protein [Deefgea sp. CFH1-16]